MEDEFTNLNNRYLRNGPSKQSYQLLHWNLSNHSEHRDGGEEFPGSISPVHRLVPILILFAG